MQSCIGPPHKYQAFEKVRYNGLSSFLLQAFLCIDSFKAFFQCIGAPIKLDFVKQVRISTEELVTREKTKQRKARCYEQKKNAPSEGSKTSLDSCDPKCNGGSKTRLRHPKAAPTSMEVLIHCCDFKKKLPFSKESFLKRGFYNHNSG